jgi:hypothetical protein
LKSQLHFLHVRRDAKTEARSELLSSADDELITSLVECAISTLNENRKQSKDEKSKLSKYKNRLRALMDPKSSFKSKQKLNLKKVGL